MLAWHEGRFAVPVFDFRACTHARVHTRLFLLRWCQACTTSILIYTSTDASAMAVLHVCIPPPPPPRDPSTHGSFASPGTQQSRKNGIIESPKCPCPVGAPLAVPGSARRHPNSSPRRRHTEAQLSTTQHSGAQRLSPVRDRAPRRCPLASGVCFLIQDSILDTC